MLRAVMQSATSPRREASLFNLPVIQRVTGFFLALRLNGDRAAAPGHTPGMGSATWKIRLARPPEAATMTSLAFRSKASNGYDAAFMAACQAELTFDARSFAAAVPAPALGHGLASGDVRFTPSNRRSGWGRGMTACDPDCVKTNSWRPRRNIES